MAIYFAGGPSEHWWCMYMWQLSEMNVNFVMMSQVMSLTSFLVTLPRTSCCLLNKLFILPSVHCIFSHPAHSYGRKPLIVPPSTPRAGAIMARGALPNLLNRPVSLATCRQACHLIGLPKELKVLHRLQVNTAEDTKQGDRLICCTYIQTCMQEGNNLIEEFVSAICNGLGYAAGIALPLCLAGKQCRSGSFWRSGSLEAAHPLQQMCDSWYERCADHSRCAYPLKKCVWAGGHHALGELIKLLQKDTER